jgi:hypothetical protein
MTLTATMPAKTESGAISTDTDTEPTAFMSALFLVFMMPSAIDQFLASRVARRFVLISRNCDARKGRQNPQPAGHADAPEITLKSYQPREDGRAGTRCAHPNARQLTRARLL